MTEHDENKLGRPTEEEIGKVPRWAQVAFAARCARRVQPLFNHVWPDAPKKHRDAVDAAITVAERWASTATVIVAAQDATTAATVAARAASSTATAAISREARASAYDSARAAASAAHTAAAAAYAAHDAAQNSTTSSHAAYTAIFPAEPAPFATAARSDFELLKTAAIRERWTDDTPVPPQFFGAIWPDGEPEGWPEDAMEPRIGDRQFELIVEGPPGACREDVLNNTRKLVRSLDRLNRSSGGNGIRIDDEVDVFDLRGVNQPLPTGGGL